MNWPLLFREICEAYQCLPTDLEELTYDQLYILAVRKALLKSANHLITVDELRATGKIPIPRPGEPQSLVQRIRARKTKDSQPSERQLKRQRRREYEAALKAARARGDKI